MDDMEIDPELAAQMGFSAFGSGATKKRKLNADEAFTDLPNNEQSATGSNSQPLGQPQVRKPDTVPEVAPNKPAPSTTSDSTDVRALARGVRNERGDMAYFLPSFLEDPWEALRKKAV